MSEQCAAASGPRRPRVKICGVTRVRDAELAIDLGAELIGLNFYSPSPRHLSPERAAELVRRVGKRRAIWVGVFVDEPVSSALEIADQVGLDLLQFHGDESPASLRSVAGRAIKALRVERQVRSSSLEPWLDLGLWGLLLDARHETLYGGSGRSWDFASAASVRDRSAASRLLVAGGLGPHNVRAAASATRPWAVDLASGVESSPGVKDPDLLHRLFAQLTEETPDGKTPTAA